MAGPSTTVKEEELIPPRKRARKKLNGALKQKKNEASPSMLTNGASQTPPQSASISRLLSMTGGQHTGSVRRFSTDNRIILKRAEDYWHQLGCPEDLRVTDDGLDIFCVKCNRVLSKVALGQRIRVDNLRTHINSTSHQRAVSHCFLSRFSSYNFFFKVF